MTREKTMQQTQTAIMNHKPTGEIVTTVNSGQTNNNNNNSKNSNNNTLVNNSVVNSVTNVVVTKNNSTANSNSSTQAAPDAKAKQVLKEAVDAVVNSFAKHTQGYGRGKFILLFKFQFHRIPILLTET